MTAIWDRLSSKSQSLANEFDEGQGEKLRFVLTEIYDVIKFHDEYKNTVALLGYIKKTNLLEILRAITKDKFDKSACDHAYHIIEALHDFDHEHDGHHTEQLIMKDKKKTGQQMLLDISNDWWWKGEVDPNV